MTTEQRITVERDVNGLFADRALYFRTISGQLYRLTHYERVDSRIVYVHGYSDEPDGVKFYTSRTPDEIDPRDLANLHGTKA